MSMAGAKTLPELHCASMVAYNLIQKTMDLFGKLNAYVSRRGL
jgi:hypothetical protein